MTEQWPKRYQASERKLQYLRRVGAHPRSRMVCSFFALVAGLGAIMIAARVAFIQPLADLIQLSLQQSAHAEQPTLEHLGRGLLTAGSALTPVGLASLGGWLLGNLLQSGFALSWPWSRNAEVTYYRIPRSGPDTLVRGLLAAALLAAVAASLLALLRQVAALPLEAPMSVGQLGWAYLRPSLTIILPAVVAVVGLDWIWSRYSYMAAAGMTEAERRREFRDTELSWLSRWRLSKRRPGGNA